MKNLSIAAIFTLVVFICIPGSAQAQGWYNGYNGVDDDVTGLTGIGLMAGLNLAKETGDDAEIAGETRDWKPGFIGGGFLTYNFLEYLAVQPEVLFSMKGSKFTATENGLEIEHKNNYNYLEVPVLLKLTPAMESGLMPTLFAGPAVAFLLGAKSKAEGTGIDAEVDIKDSLKTVDFGIAFGAGVGYGFGAGEIGFNARYTLGLTNFADIEPEPDIRNSAISIGAYYSFR